MRLPTQRAIASLATLTHLSGLNAVARGLTRSKVPILTYHSVGTPKDGERSCLELTRMRVRPQEFREQMEYVARHYTTVTFRDVMRSRSAPAAVLPANACVITFDDGYLDVYHNAVPVLEEFGLKATFFIMGRPMASRDLPWLHAVHEILDTVPANQCAAAFEKAAPGFFQTTTATKTELCEIVRQYFDRYDRRTRAQFLSDVRAELPNDGNIAHPFMDDSHIRNLLERGFEIGGHSMDHESMARLSDDELRADIVECREVLSAVLGAAPSTFCYPFGTLDSFDDRVIAILQQEGFECACTTIHGINRDSTNPFALRRIGVYTGTSFPVFACRLVGIEGALRNAYRPFKPNNEKETV